MNNYGITVLSEYTNNKYIHDLYNSMYSDPKRAYHNHEHIDDVLRKIETISQHELTAAPDEIIIAALFHDLFYSRLSGDVLDVHRSAIFASMVSEQCGYHKAACSRIHDLVLSTAVHSPILTDQKVLCDADLAMPISYSDCRTNELFCIMNTLLSIASTKSASSSNPSI